MPLSWPAASFLKQWQLCASCLDSIKLESELGIQASLAVTAVEERHLSTVQRSFFVHKVLFFTLLQQESK